MTVSQHSPSQLVWAATAGWWLFALWGIAGVLLGGWLLFQPIASALALVTIVAFWQATTAVQKKLDRHLATDEAACSKPMLAPITSDKACCDER